MALVNALNKPTNDPAAAAPIARQVANERSKDRLLDFLEQGTNQSPTALAGQYGEMFDASPGGFSFGEASSLGMDPAATAAINARTRNLLNQNVGFQRANLLRSSTGDYSNRMNTYQGISDAVTRQRLLQEQIEAQKKIAKKAKRAATGAAVGGIVGAGAGLFAANPAAGAMIGSGIGSAVGGQVG